MKTISICIACYNEQDNIVDTYSRITKIMRTVAECNYEIIFADNCSKDNSQTILRDLANMDKHVKVIINNRNFGSMHSGKNACYSATGDAIISLPCDLQEPPEMIPQFIKEWENGNLIVWGKKTESKERGIKKICRIAYYKIINKLSDIPQYEQTTGFGIVDRRIIDEIKLLQEPDMAMRHLVAELGYPVKFIPYTQQKRKAGKSSYNIWRYFDFSVTSLVRTTTVPLRITTVIGVFSSIISFILGVIYLIYKLINWNAFSVGTAPMVIAVFFIGSVQLLSIGMIGEYLSIVLKKVTKRPLVTIKEKINFDEIYEDEKK